MLQVFESHAEYLGPALFEEFAFPYLKQIQQRVRARVDVPMVNFSFDKFHTNFPLISH